MIKLNSYIEVLNLVAEIRGLKKGFITNFYPNESKIELWIKHNVFFYERFDDTIFLFKTNIDFSTCYYCSTNPIALNNSLNELRKKHQNSNLFFDIIGSETQCNQIKDIFIKTEFKVYNSLVRMTRKTPEISDECNEKQNKITFATIAESLIIFNLLHQHFDARAEQLPFIEEIEKLAEDKQILVLNENSKIVGFIIFEKNVSTLYLRYWFTLPEYRDKKIGSALINSFFKQGESTKRQLFWVIQNNENAIKRYRHFGFEPENMYDYILSNNK